MNGLWAMANASNATAMKKRCREKDQNKLHNIAVMQPTGLECKMGIK